MLTERINSKFKSVRFRLFQDQVNGGVKDDCEVLVPTAEGVLVPYQHLPELDVVVALDGTAACTETGDPIPFDRRKATRLRVMDLEQALDLLRAG